MLKTALSIYYRTYHSLVIVDTHLWSYPEDTPALIILNCQCPQRGSARSGLEAFSRTFSKNLPATGWRWQRVNTNMSWSRTQDLEMWRSLRPSLVRCSSEWVSKFLWHLWHCTMPLKLLSYLWHCNNRLLLSKNQLEYWNSEFSAFIGHQFLCEIFVRFASATRNCAATRL